MFTLKDGTALASASITVYCKSKADAVQFVADFEKNFGEISMWTTTIEPVKYEDFSVHIVIIEWSGDTAKLLSSFKQGNI